MNAIENLANVWAISTIEDLQYERYFGIAIEFFFFGEKENPWEKKKEKNDIKNIPGMAIWLSVEVSVWPGLRHEQYLNENYLEIARQPL